jgi:hypothetical protein
LYTEALEAISEVDHIDWEGKFDPETGLCNGSVNYTWYQITFMHAICLKLLGRFDESYERY